MARSRECRWKCGARTACPILMDNLTPQEVDALWGEISNINWIRRAEEREPDGQQPLPARRSPRGQKRIRPRRAT